MADRCPTCNARLGWKAVLRSAGWPFYAKCRACGARLRLFDPWQFLEALAAGLVPAALVVIAAAALDLIQSLVAGVLTGAAAGGAAALTMVWWLLRRAEWKVREPAVWSDPQGRHYLYSAGANVVLGTLLVVGVTAVGIAALSLRGRDSHEFRFPPARLPAAADVVSLGAVDPDWSVQTLDGRRLSMGELRGRTLFVNLWATWCGPCVAEMPSIQGLYESLADDATVEFLIVSNEPPLTVAAFVEESGYTFPAFVADEPPPGVLETTGIPATFVINPRGEVVFRHVGAADWNTNECRRFLKELR